MAEIRIGVVGYSAQAFDVEEAKDALEIEFDAVRIRFSHIDSFEVVSGLTNLGIPALAYLEAKKRGWGTVGIACAKAREFECFPVDREILVGREWGDESPTFLSYIDILVRIGGGKQSHEEVEAFRKTGKTVLEWDLPISGK